MWHTFINPADLEAEKRWLADNVGGAPDFKVVKATERYSNKLTLHHFS